MSSRIGGTPFGVRFDYCGSVTQGARRRTATLGFGVEYPLAFDRQENHGLSGGCEIN
jgi:hypothetical protein